MRQLRSERGMILAIAVVNIMVMMSLMVTWVSWFGGSNKLVQDATLTDVETFNLAMIGVTEAKWRIKNNYTIGMQPQGPDFTMDAWDPLPLYMDIDGFTFSNVKRPVDDLYFDIGPKLNGERAVTAYGLTKQGVD